MKKLLLIVLTTVLTTVSYSQIKAYSNSYKFYVYNSSTEQWDYITKEDKYSKFVFTDEDYVLIESEGEISKYDVISFQKIDNTTMFTLKESGGKIYYFSMDKEYIYFLHKDEDGGIYQIQFDVYIWEK